MPVAPPRVSAALAALAAAGLDGKSVQLVGTGVWDIPIPPDTAPGAAERAAAAPPPPVPTEVVDAVEKRGWYVRDTFYPYEILCENLIDPAHLPVSHHGLATLDRANAMPVPIFSFLVAAAAKDNATNGS